MNIYGLGTDIVNINRIKKVITTRNQSFKRRVFTSFEIKVCEKRKNKFECFAKRFAAKEALFKAIGQKNKLKFKDVEVKNSYSGLPNFTVKGSSKKNLNKIFKKKKFKIHLSLSDDKPWAIASVIVFVNK